MRRIDVPRRLRRAILLNDLPLVQRIVRNNPDYLRNPDYEDKSSTNLHLAAKHGFTQIAVCHLARNNYVIARPFSLTVINRSFLSMPVTKKAQSAATMTLRRLSCLLLQPAKRRLAFTSQSASPSAFRGRTGLA